MKQKEFKKEALIWRTRAFIFAKTLVDSDQTKEVLGLFEGAAGEICLLSDLLGDENEVRFPGFEI